MPRARLKAKNPKAGAPKSDVRCAASARHLRALSKAVAADRAAARVFASGPRRALLLSKTSGGAAAAAPPYVASVYRQWGPVSAVDTCAETPLLVPGAGAIGSAAVPANSAQPGTTYVVRLAGCIASSVVGTTVFRLKLGGATIVALPAALAVAGAIPYDIEFTVTYTAVGARGRVNAVGRLLCSDAPEPIATGQMLNAAVDTTADDALDVTGQALCPGAAQGFSAVYASVTRT